LNQPSKKAAGWIGYRDCESNVLVDSTASMGLRATEIANKLRMSHALADRSLSYGRVDVREFPEEQLRKFQARDKDLAEAAAAWSSPTDLIHRYS
jgi:hypothetical protein